MRVYLFNNLLDKLIVNRPRDTPVVYIHIILITWRDQCQNLIFKTPNRSAFLKNLNKIPQKPPSRRSFWDDHLESGNEWCWWLFKKFSVRLNRIPEKNGSEKSKVQIILRSNFISWMLDTGFSIEKLIVLLVSRTYSSEKYNLFACKT